MKPKGNRNRHPAVILLVALVIALFFLGWSQASLNLSFIHPTSAVQTILLISVSAVIFLAFVIFFLILLRILLKLYVERRQGQLGSHFKTKMVAAFLALSLVPVFFLFVFAYGLLNRSIDKWFGIPFEVVRKDASEIVRQIELSAESRVLHISSHLSADIRMREALQESDTATLHQLLAQEVGDREDEAVLCFSPRGRLLAVAGQQVPSPAEILDHVPKLASGHLPAKGILTHWQGKHDELFLNARPVKGGLGRPLGSIVGVTRFSLNIEQMANQIQHETQKYNQLSKERKAVKRNYLSILWLLTLLILFAATWFALFLSKQVTVPIQALVEATHEISKGNLAYQVPPRGDGELRSLILSFNEMTRQLQENRRAIEQASHELHRANRELEERKNTIEAILENIPTGVISLDPEGRITRANSTVLRMFGREGAKPVTHLTDLFSAENAREIQRLLRRAARQGVVTRQMDLDLGSRHASMALTLSSIRARHETVGSVLVLEDLSELLRVQKAAAWQEVAQRIAHEIKNPLTPIQLSAERISRLASRNARGDGSRDILAAVDESAMLISREVDTLKRLVDEFSKFARFPHSTPSPCELNAVIENALNVFDGRLNGITIRCDLTQHLPTVMADPEQMKRAVVNLIDNAAEALEGCAFKEIEVSTRLDTERDVVQVEVSDSGPGITSDAKERLFLPYFSTKRRGTGLGLAIVSRIISEHNGWIRVEDNYPTGTKFIIELPADHVDETSPV